MIVKEININYSKYWLATSITLAILLSVATLPYFYFVFFKTIDFENVGILILLLLLVIYFVNSSIRIVKFTQPKLILHPEYLIFNEYKDENDLFLFKMFNFVNFEYVQLKIYWRDVSKIGYTSSSTNGSTNDFILKLITKYGSHEINIVKLSKKGDEIYEEITNHLNFR